MSNTKEKKICVVTGASRGIGYELVKRMSKEPGMVVYAFSRNETNLKKLGEYSSSIRYFTGDITIKEDRIGLYKKILKEEGKLDFLVNNAGLLYNKDIHHINDEEIELTFDVNIISVIKLIQELLPL